MQIGLMFSLHIRLNNKALKHHQMTVQFFFQTEQLQRNY